MKRNSKVLALLMCLALASGVCACGSKGGESGASQTADGGKNTSEAVTESVPATAEESVAQETEEKEPAVTTVSTATSTNPEKLEGVTFEDEIAAAKAQIAELGDDVDAILFVTHLGDNALAANVTSE